MTGKSEPVIQYREVGKEESEQSPTAPVNPIVAWSNEARSLRQSTVQQCLWMVYDIGLILLPLSLIVKIALVIFAEHHDAENVGVWLEQASDLSRYLIAFNDQLVTLFTMIFMTVLSTFVKRYALWRAQQGACLPELEQFQGSISLPSTIKLVLLLRSWNVTSVVLLIVWSFYYIGSQAAKNEYRLTDSGYMSRQPFVLQRTDSIGLFSPGAEAYLNATQSNRNRDDLLYNLDIQFTKIMFGGSATTCLDGTPEGKQSSDSGPLLFDLSRAHHAPAYANRRDRVLKQSRGWQDVTVRTQSTKRKGCGYIGFHNFAGSLITRNSDSTYSTKFSRIVGTYTINNASYLTTTCSDFSNPPDEELDSILTGLNMIVQRQDTPLDYHGNPLREIEYWWRSGSSVATNETEAPITESVSGRAVCNITRKYVDIGVECVSSMCYVARMRWANNVGEAKATTYSTPFDSEEFARGFLSSLTISTGYGYVDLVSDINYKDSLSRTINTYLSLSQFMLTRQPDLGQSLDTLLQNGGNEIWGVEKANAALYTTKYRVYWQWVPLDLVANLILLAAAFASLWLRLNTIAPDVLGYVSSLTRDNPRFMSLTEGSTMDGISRSRMLRDVKVKIGGVYTPAYEGSIERISLVPADVRVTSLRKDNVYI